MTEDRQAELLARWLDAGPGAPSPDDLDDPVVEAVIALRPEYAQPPRVSLDDILGAVTVGPFSEAEAPASPEEAAAAARLAARLDGLPVTGAEDTALEAVYALRPDLAPPPRLDLDELLAGLRAGPLQAMPSSLAEDRAPAGGPDVAPAAEAIPLAPTRRRARWGTWGALAAAALVLVVALPATVKLRSGGMMHPEAEAPAPAPLPWTTAPSTGASPTAPQPAAAQGLAESSPVAEVTAEPLQRQRADEKPSDSLSALGYAEGGESLGVTAKDWAGASGGSGYATRAGNAQPDPGPEGDKGDGWGMLSKDPAPAEPAPPPPPVGSAAPIPELEDGTVASADWDLDQPPASSRQATLKEEQAERAKPTTTASVDAALAAPVAAAPSRLQSTAGRGGSGRRSDTTSSSREVAAAPSAGASYGADDAADLSEADEAILEAKGLKKAEESDNSRALRTLADARQLASRGLPDEAMARLLPLLDSPDPSVVGEAALQIAALHLAQGRLDEAAAVIDRALNMSPPAVLRGRLLAFQSRLEEPAKPVSAPPP